MDLEGLDTIKEERLALAIATMPPFNSGPCEMHMSYSLNSLKGVI